jgi:hypothetical protein
MGDLDLAGLKAMLAEATPGPWTAIKGVEASDDMRCGVAAVRGDKAYLVATIENGAPGDVCDTEYANARLIVAAKTAFPALIQRIEELEEALKPFAEAADAFNDCEQHPNGCPDSAQAGELVDLTVGDFRRARSALTPTKGR